MNKLPILTKKKVNQQMKIMQNEPNLRDTQMNLNLFKTTNYVIFRPLQRRKNEPNSNPICAESNPISNFGPGFNQFMKNMQNEPNLRDTQINVTTVIAKDYMKNDVFAPPKNEPKTNPIKANSNPILPKTNPIQSQFLEL